MPGRPQLVVCGDFLQLAPVAVSGGASLENAADEAMYVAKALDAPAEPVESADEWIRRAQGLDPADGRHKWSDAWKTTPFALRETQGAYAFQSVAWRRADFRIHNLTRVYRTADDVLIAAQRAMRRGDLASEAVARLIELTRRPLQNDDGIVSTIVVPRRQAVAEINQRKLMELPEDTEHAYRADDSVMPDGGAPWIMQQLERDSFFRDCPADSRIVLRLGAQVMLVKNDGEYGALVNGSRGVVVGFEDEGGPVAYPRVRFTTGVTRVCLPVEFKKAIYGRGRCTRVQLPLALAWGITVHKAQGASLDRVTVDLDGTFANGQAYVAVSRARSIDGLEIRNFNASAVRTQPLVGAFYRAVDDGTVDAFLADPALWWGAPLRQPERARWRALYCRHPLFAGWYGRAE